MHLDKLRAGGPQEGNLGASVALLPLGSFEQHGQHLPFNTDATIATALARKIEEALPERVVLLPTLWFGKSTQHQMLGEISTSTRTYPDMLKDITHSLVRMGFRKILFLNAHGGNEIPASLAILELKREFRAAAEDGIHVVLASWWRFVQDVLDRETKGMATTANGDRLGNGVGHADDIETSLMLYLAPEQVDMSRARAGGPRSGSDYKMSSVLREAYPIFMAIDADEWAVNGVNGVPEDGSAAAGAAIMKAAVERLVSFTGELLKWGQG